MQLKILGCGTSTGVPIPGCDCEVCTSKDPKNWRNRTSALISTDSGENILIDTTPDFRHQAIKFGIKRIDAVLYTHSHADHIFGLDDLRGFNFKHGSIPCFGTAHTLKQIQRAFEYVFEVGEKHEGGALPKVTLHQISAGASFPLFGVTVEPFALMHGTLEIVGYKIGNLAYATDCNRVPKRSLSLLDGIENLIIDGLRYQEHATHFTIPEAIEVSAELGAKKTYLTHMCHSVEYNRVSKVLPQNVALAYDGLDIQFSA